ncbi:hypothetical protein C0992_011292, partial [Termitomyces sp. T32_za158]
PLDTTKCRVHAPPALHPFTERYLHTLPPLDPTTKVRVRRLGIQRRECQLDPLVDRLRNSPTFAGSISAGDRSFQ